MYFDCIQFFAFYYLRFLFLRFLFDLFLFLRFLFDLFLFLRPPPCVAGAVGGGVAGGVVAGAEAEPGPRAATGPEPGADGLGPGAGVDCCAPILT
jgi:hypothetical protein